MVTFLDPTITPFAATFFFVFALIFGLLSYAGKSAEGKEKPLSFSKRVNAVIALAFAFFSVLYEPLVTGLQQFIPLATVFLIIIFFLLFLKKLFGADKKEKEDTLPMVASIAILLVVLGVLGDRILAYLPIGLDANSFLWIAGLFFVILIFYGVWSRKEGP